MSAPPEAQIALRLPALRRGDPAQIQEVKSLQFMLIVGKNTWTALLDRWAGFQTAG
jgi:predicted phosphoadenosine phosphosulfate sulfurtransferase